MIAIKRNNLAVIMMDHYHRVMNKPKGSRLKLLPKYLADLKNAYGLASYQNRFILQLECDLKINNSDPESSIITASPKTLEEKFHSYNAIFPILSGDYEFLERIQNCFYYSNYDKWGAYKLAGDLSVDVCPYCNRAYTFTIGSDLTKGTRPQFDHYISKSLAPYFSLSFYNLIPSCYICNSGFKKAKFLSLTEHIHPYQDDLSDHVRFSIGAKSIGFIEGNADAYTLNLVRHKDAKLSDFDNQRILNTYSLFRLKILYERHKDYVDELIQKDRVFTASRLTGIYNDFKGTLFKSPSDVLRMALGNYTAVEDLEKRPLSKLTRDISQELNELKNMTNL